MTVSQQWDLRHGLLYLRLTEGAVARTAEIDADTNVDLDAAGKVLGIEVLAPDSRWPLTEIIHRYRHLISDGDMRELIAGYPFAAPEVELPRVPDRPADHQQQPAGRQNGPGPQRERPVDVGPVPG